MGWTLMFYSCVLVMASQKISDRIIKCRQDKVIDLANEFSFISKLASSQLATLFTAYPN
jgi:hypothetical protein